MRSCIRSAAAVGLAAIALAQGVAAGAESLGAPPPLHPPDNPPTPEKVALGRELFFDKRLSRDNTVSCGTCHDPNAAFAGPHPRTVGLRGQATRRNTMTILNVTHLDALLWDGRVATLEEQVLLPFEEPVEFDLPVEEALVRLRRYGYEEKFQAAFGEGVTAANLGKAIAVYERSLAAGDSPFDRYMFGGERAAVSAEVVQGYAVFLRSDCDRCHLISTSDVHPFAAAYAPFTDGRFHNIGVGMDAANPDLGRFERTREPGDRGRFRTPTLRNVALTAPYFHDGSAARLEDVIDWYDGGGLANPNLDPGVRKLGLSPEDKKVLKAFLVSLTSAHAGSFAGEEAKVRDAGVRAELR